jgi:NTP pyrophosphatase (non-canonical NTP hydrolase)
VSSPPIKVAICGSFRRDPDGIKAVYAQLRAAGATVLSPLDPNFVSEREGFVFAAAERDEQPQTIEERHLQAMRDADFVWLHAPGGYVGVSATAELGFAHALQLRVFTRTRPAEAVIADWVEIVENPAAAIATVGDLEGGNVKELPDDVIRVLQEYYLRAATRRGWDKETPTRIVELLREEVEELDRALRATVEGTVSNAGENPDLELADVVLYAVHLANARQRNLSLALQEKERINSQRFG